MNIEKNELEKQIENKIRDAKLDLWESRFKIFLWFGGALIVIFGVIFPFWRTDKNSERVEQAIQNMERRFEKLAGMQIREPNLEFFVDGQGLEGTTVNYVDGKFQFPYFELKNIGDAPATNIRVRLYLGEHKKVATGSGTQTWKKRGDLTSQEIGFPHELHYNYFEKGGVQFEITGRFGSGGRTEKYGETFERLDPTESVRVFLRELNRFFVNFGNPVNEEARIPALFKIYYGQPEPKRIHFSIFVTSNK